jgi:transcriptional regulator PpsR
MHWRISSLVKAFLTPQTSLGDLDAASAATLIAAAADIAVIVDAGGIVCDMAFHSAELSAELPNADGWIGRPFVATVAPDSRAKTEALLRNAGTEAAARWRHVNHLNPQGASIPVLYSAAPVCDDGRVVAFGRDLRAVSALQQRLVNAQQSLDRDYARLREVEMRYRLLFQNSAESVLVVEAARNKVTEANPAALRLFGVPGEQLVGKPLTDLFASESASAVQAHLGAVRAGGRADDATVLLADGETAVALSAALFRQETATLFLVRLARTQPNAGPSPSDDVRTRLLAVVDHGPDAFVLTDHDGQILAANAAFLDMAQLASEEQARGESLDRWLGQSALDLDVLITNVRQRGSIRFFATSVRGENGATAQVEVSAVAVAANGGQPNFGFAIRNVGPRLRTESRIGRDLPRSVEQLTELIGRVALKDLVREATDVIERLCIEAALELTGDNRASAAEMLGLSRQSLYVKLRRYGLGDLDTDGRD